MTDAALILLRDRALARIDALYRMLHAATGDVTLSDPDPVWIMRGSIERAWDLRRNRVLTRIRVWREQCGHREHSLPRITCPYCVGKKAMPGEPAWYLRERQRMATNDYGPLPPAWRDLTWPAGHFPHPSRKDPGMIAYTPSEEYGQRDRKVVIKPGRYLAQTHPEIPEAERARLAGYLSVYPLAFATTADDIETLYRYSDMGCRSCMGPDRAFRDGGCDPWPDGQHPTRVYGDSDLAVAYIGPLRGALARAVVWPARKRWARIYGDHHRLQAALTEAGYTQGSLAGARVRLIPDPDQKSHILMPYVDGISCAEIDGDHLILGRGGINASSTDGSVPRISHTCERCGEDCGNNEDLCEACAEIRCVCDRCNDVFFDEDQPTYCESCENQREYCEVCHGDHFDGGMAEILYPTRRGGTEVLNACPDCQRNAAPLQFVCRGCEAECSEGLVESLPAQEAREANGTRLIFCEDCAETHRVCHACAETTAIEGPCGACGIVPRCPATLPLPLTSGAPAGL